MKTHFKPAPSSGRHHSAFLGVIIIAVSVGYFLIRSFKPHFTGRFIQQGNTGNAVTAVEMVLALFFMIFVAAAFYILALGRRRFDNRRFSPRNAKTAGATQVMSGQRTALRGQMMIFIAILLIVLALIGWMLARSALPSLFLK